MSLTAETESLAEVRLDDIVSNSSLPSPAPSAVDFSGISPLAEQQIRGLQAALQDRDDVVQLLTQRLEQAANQLDRLQRSGPERRGSSLPGIPAELIESQQSVLDQMTQMLSRWEEMQAGQMLSRIESQISDIHDLVSPGAPRSTASDDDVKSSKSAWEQMKAALFADEKRGTSSFHRPATSVKSDSESATTEPFPQEVDCSMQLPDPPLFVNLDEANIDDLRVAVQSRDEYISTLIRRFTSQSQSTRLPDWEQLNQAPEDLRIELQDLQAQLSERLRIAEVDLSLQRARLARDEGRLQAKLEEANKKSRQMELSAHEIDSSAEPPLKNVSTEQQAQQGRRWLQFLQRSANNSPSDKP